MRRMLELAMFLSIISLDAMAASFSFSNAGFTGGLKRGVTGVDYSFATSNLFAVWSFQFKTNISGTDYVPDMWSTNRLKADDRFGSPFPTLDTTRYLTNCQTADVQSVLFKDDVPNDAWLYQPFGETQSANQWTNGFSGLVWVFCTNSPVGTIICRYTATDASWTLDIDGNGNFRFLAQTNNLLGSITVTNNVPIVSRTNVWLPIQFRAQPFNVNGLGLKVGTNAWRFAALPGLYFNDLTPCDLTVGNRGDGTYCFDGLADNYFVWTNAVATNDLQKLVDGVRDNKNPLPPH